MDTDRRGFMRKTAVSAAAGTAGTAGIGTVSAQEAGEEVEDGVYRVEMTSENIFTPIGIHVEPGDTVRWVSTGGVHNAASYEGRIPEDAEPFDYETVGEGGEIEHTFEVEGTYDYYCLPHRSLGMVGRVVCGEPGGPAEGSTPADGDVPGSDVVTREGVVTYEDFMSGVAPPALDPSTLAKGIGGLVVTSLAAAGAYLAVSSEGEPYRVGSAEWREEERTRGKEAGDG